MFQPGLPHFPSPVALCGDLRLRTSITPPHRHPLRPGWSSVPSPPRPVRSTNQRSPSRQSRTPLLVGVRSRNPASLLVMGFRRFLGSVSVDPLPAHASARKSRLATPRPRTTHFAALAPSTSLSGVLGSSTDISSSRFLSCLSSLYVPSPPPHVRAALTGPSSHSLAYFPHSSSLVSFSSPHSHHLGCLYQFVRGSGSEPLLDGNVWRA
jgi:hypothetical protein